MSVKHLTILHSNDLHGDFLPQDKDGISTGGLPRLSGFVKQKKQENENTIYAIAGDMFRGSVIDSEYMGLSTIDMVNLLGPDVATIGNHEVDYGIAHLLFLEKCAEFPIINANMIINFNHTRMFRPYMYLNVGGIKVLFIGILTQEVISSARQERVIGTFIDIEDAAREVGIICDNYRTREADVTVLLTHIGIDEDIKLAQLLDPAYGVDVIIGGHSHTFMDEPVVVNGIPIVQAGTGTGVIGRMEIDVETETNEILSWNWICEPINEDTAPVDEVMEELLEHYREETDRKYKKIVTRFARPLTNPARNQETELCNLYADILQQDSSYDIMFMGTGSIRKKEMGPIVDYETMIENTPYDSAVWMLKVTGKQLREMLTYIFRDDAWVIETEFYNFSKGFRVVYNKSTHTFEEVSLNGSEVTDDQEILIAMQTYHYINFEEFFHVSLDDVKKNMNPRIVATSVINVVEEYFSTHKDIDSKVEGRIVIKES